MAVFDDAKFQEVLTTEATKVLGVVPALDWMGLLTEFLRNAFSTCFGNPTPAAPNATPADVAAQIKNASMPQKAIIEGRIIGHYRRSGKTRRDGIAAFQTLENSVAVTPEADLALMIDHAKTDATPIPDFNLD